MSADPSARVVLSLAEGGHAPAWQALVLASPAATAVVDRRGLVVLWNAAAERLLGVRAATLLGKPLPVPFADRTGPPPGWLTRALAGETVAELAWQDWQESGAGRLLVGSAG